LQIGRCPGDGGERFSSYSEMPRGLSRSTERVAYLDGDTQFKTDDVRLVGGKAFVVDGSFQKIGRGPIITQEVPDVEGGDVGRFCESSDKAVVDSHRDSSTRSFGDGDWKHDGVCILGGVGGGMDGCLRRDQIETYGGAFEGLLTALETIITGKAVVQASWFALGQDVIVVRIAMLFIQSM
jgi:hypothetical protein